MRVSTSVTVGRSMEWFSWRAIRNSEKMSLVVSKPKGVLVSKLNFGRTICSSSLPLKDSFPTLFRFASTKDGGLVGRVLL